MAVKFLLRSMAEKSSENFNGKLDLPFKAGVHRIIWPAHEKVKATDFQIVSAKSHSTESRDGNCRSSRETALYRIRLARFSLLKIFLNGRKSRSSISISNELTSDRSVTSMCSVADCISVEIGFEEIAFARAIQFRKILFDHMNQMDIYFQKQQILMFRLLIDYV